MKLTPLIEEHRKTGAKLAPFGGWLMPIQYTGIIAEHQWARSSVTLFDICHMGEFFVRGKKEISELEKIVTVNVQAIPIGACRYGFMLNDEGGIIDDVVVYKIKDDYCMLVVNAATTESDENNLRKYLSAPCQLENASDILGKLDLQGPMSREVLKNIIGDKICALEYYTFDYFPLLGENIIISRTGYTGELGYELYIKNEKVKQLWTLILEDKRVIPAGLGARDTLRLEVGYPLYGQDIDLNITPLEAGLDKFIDFNKEFIGKKALLKKKKEGIKRQLAYFICSCRRSPRHNYKIYADNKEIGVVTSGSFSPSVSCGVAMGYIDKLYNKKGISLELKQGDISISAVVTEKPFYKKGTARIK